MKRPAPLIFLLAAILFGVSPARAQQLVHYWNFTNSSSQTALLTPSISLVGGASIAHIAGGSSAIEFAGDTGQNFDIDNLNARNGDGPGTHLRFNNPINGSLVVAKYHFFVVFGVQGVAGMTTTRNAKTLAQLDFQPIKKSPTAIKLSGILVGKTALFLPVIVS
jgi:hypothetical protein